MIRDGFDPQFDGLEDFLRKVTEGIWQDKDVGQISDWYGEHVQISTPWRESRDVEAAVRTTLEALHTFPDRTMLSEDILWSEDEPNGFYASHRIFSDMTHWGEGVYGAPTGKHLGVRMIADRVCVGSSILREWHVVDQAGIALGIESTRDALAERFLEQRQAKGLGPFDPDELVARWAGGPEGDLPDGVVAGLIERYCAMWSGGNAGIVPELYDQAATLHAPGGETLIGDRSIARFLSGYRAAFPKGEVIVHHTVVREDPSEPVRVALRWSFRTRHDGFGRFGAPSEAEAVILAISQFELRGGLIRREYLMIDEVSVATQILASQRMQA
jgi:hypothetical protein